MVIMLVRPLPYLWFLYNGFSLLLGFLLFLCVSYSAGAVASIFLFRGAIWARKFIWVVAFLSLAVCGLTALTHPKGDSVLFVVLFASFSLASFLVFLRDIFSDSPQFS
jgi:hypothetical protein